MIDTLYFYLLKPKAQDDDKRRREFILNTLLLGVIALNFLLFVMVTIEKLQLKSNYVGGSPLILIGASLFFVGMLVLSRMRFWNLAAYAFVSTFLILATYPTYRWGLLLPQGILTYSLVIVMAGVLLNSWVAFRITLVIVLILGVLEHLSRAKIIRFDTSWTRAASGYNDIVAYGLTFMAIALVSWLSNREIERSLHRAQRSENALREERNLLEVKVRERTKALEKVQVEKMLELHRFAEFGRFSSTLLHELTNPLTAVSLNLEQLEANEHSNLIEQARQGITYIEQCVEAARRQLRNESEIKLFDVVQEIERVISLLEPKARTHRVLIRARLEAGPCIRGDSIRFNQIIANLVANAIDAYNEIELRTKLIAVSSKQRGGNIEIRIRDRGVGIAPKEVNHIFEPFYTTKTVQRGTGLGLTITKKIVEEDFGGTITAESNRRKGTCFVLMLPLSESHSPDEQEQT